MGSHRVHNHWMYQDFVLLLAWWWLVVAEIFCQDFKNLICWLIQVVSLTVINCYTKYRNASAVQTSTQIHRTRTWMEYACQLIISYRFSSGQCYITLQIFMTLFRQLCWHSECRLLSLNCLSIFLFTNRLLRKGLPTLHSKLWSCKLLTSSASCTYVEKRCKLKANSLI
jgi:hypothetical protein